MRAGTQATRRASWLALLALLWACAIAGRLIQLQVLRGREFREISERQANKLEEIRAPRGEIRDRRGKPLALSLPLYSINVNPKQTPESLITAGILGPILRLDSSELGRKLTAAREARRGFLQIKRAASFDETETLRRLDLKWVQFQPQSQRVYPKGSLAAHLVGSVDHAERGNSGIEQALDDELRGHPGLAYTVTDVFSRGVSSVIRERPVPGVNVTLTIDERLQYAAEQALAKAVVASDSQTGSVVVMNPENGEVLALASYPSFDANRPVRSRQELANRANHAVSVPFEPGSVFKVITVAAALETTALRPESMIDCGNGRFNLLGRVIHDHHAYPVLSVADVLAKSSNIGAIQIGLRVGPSNLSEYTQRFGFGRAAGLPLPAESSGKVYDLDRWGKTSIGSVAMGHELSATTLQLARAVSVFANGGRLVPLRLILERETPGQKPRREPLEPAISVIRPETAITMRNLMERVVLSGTGTLARLDGYTSGGKTGSAQIYDPQCKCYTHFYNASFAGFAPVVRPAVVVVVTINGASEFGGAIAAPVFREVASTALRLMDVPKDLPEAPPPREDTPVEYTDLAIADLGSPAPLLPEPEIPERNGVFDLWGPRVPDFYGKTKRVVLEESAGLGLPVDLAGSGIVRAQSPSAGSILAQGERVRIRLAR